MTTTTETTPLTIEVCVDCLSLLANGEVFTTSGDDVSAQHAARMETLWGDTEITLGSIDNADDPDGDGGEPWFSRHPCKGCGSRLGGDREYATAWLKPEVEDEEDEDSHSCKEFLVEMGTSPSRSGAFEVWDECERCGSQQNRRPDSLF